MVEKINVVPVAFTVSEPSGSGTFTLTLTSQPVATVSVSLVLPMPEQCTVLPNQIILDADNWDSGALATVTAVDDSIVDGPQICWVNTEKSVSADPTFHDLSVRDVKVTVLDDDLPAITVNPTSTTIAEPAGAATFTVTLTSQPTTTVSVPLLSVAPEQCTVSPGSVTLDDTNWNTGVPATVTAVDDQIPDGTQTCLVQTGPASSTDPAYDGLPVPDVTVTVLDSNLPAVVVIPTSLTIAEPAGSDIFTLTLTSQPNASVSVSLSASNNQCTVSPKTISLNAANWETGVIATVTAVDDLIPDGTQTCLVETGSTSSTDPIFSGLPVADVTVTVYDNDLANIIVLPTSLTIAEPVGSANFFLALTSQPIAPVSVPLLSTAPEQCTVSPGAIILHAGNWDDGVPATVTAVDDLIADGPRTCPIQIGPTLSNDPNYAGLSGADVSVTVVDDDRRGTNVVPDSLTIAEPAGSATFLLTLTSQPTTTVSVALSASNEKCSVLPASVTLSASNWAAGVPVTVTAVDDFFVDGPQPCPILTGPTSSADPNYDGLPVKDIQVTILDNDVPSIAVAPPSLTIDEPAGHAVFTLTLTSQPIATVWVLLSADNGQCTVTPTIIGLKDNWATGVTATVTAVDDLIQDGTQSCPVEAAHIFSDDPNYDGLDPYTVIVTVHDLPRFSVYLPLIVSRWPPIPGVPALQPIANADGDGNYTISWTASPWADLYILEESTSSTMSGAKEIYAGTSTSFDVDGRGAARYYYHVKARNSWSESGWSAVQSVDVLWEAEPNDDAYNQANGPIVCGLTYYGTFPSGADSKDYFYFDLPSACSVEIWLTDIPAGQNYDLILRTATLTAIGYSANGGNASEHILTGTLPTGRYYIQVYNYLFGGSTQPYRLKTVCYCQDSP